MTGHEAPFVPRRGRVMALATAAIALVLFGAIAVLLPGPARGGQWGTLDKAMIFALGVAIALLMIRYARIAAWPYEDGLRVRNLILTQDVPWRDIEEVRFGGGEPWVTLDLAEGESLPVMAIQRADGPAGEQEAQRLADLVARRHHGPRHGGPARGGSPTGDA